MKTRIPRLPAAFALLAAAPFLPAQTAGSGPASAPNENDEIIQLGVFDVREDRDVGYISTNAESATRMDVAIADIPQNIVVFNQEFIQDIMAESVADVVLYDPTVTAFNEGDAFSMRGMGGAAAPGAGANYLNGFEQAGGFGSQTLVNTQRVEVLKGPNAVLYGQGAFGGTISRTSKKPQGKYATWMRSSLTESGYFRYQLDTQAPIIKKKLALRLNSMWGDGDGWRGYPKRQWVISPSLLWNITRRDTLIAEYTRTYERDVGSNLEFALHDNNPLEITLDDVRYPVDVRRWMCELDDRRIYNNNIVYAEYRHEFTKKIYFRALYNSENKETDNFETLADSQYFAIMDGQPYISRYYRQWYQKYDNYRVRAEFALNDVKTGFLNHKVIVGWGWEDLTTDSLRLQTLYNRPVYNGETNTWAFHTGSDYDYRDTTALRIAAANILTHVPGRVPYTSGGLQPYVVEGVNAAGYEIIAPQDPAVGSNLPRVNINELITTQNRSWYFSDLMSLLKDRMFLQFGLRYVDIKRIENRRGLVYNRFSTAENDRRITDKRYDVYYEHPLTHSLGWVWHLTENRAWTLYFNNNASFQPNYRTEYPEGPRLKSMTGTQYEGGVKYVYRNRFHATLSYFDILQENVPQNGLISYIDEDGVPQDRWGTTTIAGLHSKGFELTFNANPTRSWQLLGGYAYTHCINMEPAIDINTRKPLTKRHYRTPLHAVSILNTYKFNSGPVKGLEFTFGVQWRDTMLSQYIPYTTEIREEPAYKVPSFLNINLGAAYRFRIGKVRMTARINVSNATDEFNALASYNVRVQWAAPRATTIALDTSF
ncbi:MAG: TonB-dependent receptor plug domain-containing protein [Opitutaceae bacterium]|jgi:outer membrane receptor protein involved in Fe transport|nr:TonB-dependent receptor plug domain-containing protein [Opitutaceae bacterium]